jgi:hypothetical protein
MKRIALAVLLFSGGWLHADLKRAMAEPNLEKRSGLALAAASLRQSGKDPRRSNWFKKAEISTRDLGRRIQDFQDQMSYVDRPLLDKVKVRVQEVHEELLLGVMEGRKKQ